MFYEAQRVEASGFWIAIGGIIILLIVRIIQAMFANSNFRKKIFRMVIR